jgi:CelD/BcsL family acetyltransferase involved in cellulose biosynthesis
MNSAAYKVGFLKAIIVSSVDELMDYGDRWDILREDSRANIHCSYLLTKIWLNTYDHYAQPRIIFVEDKGKIIGIAPLSTYRIKVYGIPIKILSLIGDAYGILGMPFISIICYPGRQDVLETIVRQIKQMDWDTLKTIDMESIEPNNQYIAQVRSVMRTAKVTSNKHLIAEIPGSGDLAKSFNTSRININPMLRKMKKEGHDVNFRKIPSDDIDRAIDIYANQHIKRWSSKGGSFFTNPDNVVFLKGFTKAANDGGFGYAHEVLIDGEVAAQNFGLFKEDTAYNFRMGINDEFKKYSPGWMVLYYSISSLRDIGIRHITLGKGKEQLKSDLGGAESNLVGVRVDRRKVSFLTSIAGSRPMQWLDSKYNIKKGFSLMDLGKESE